MQDEPNPYAPPRAGLPARPRPTPGVTSGKSAGRRVSGRIVRYVWLGTIPVQIFGMLYAPRDGHPWQFPAAAASVLCLLVAVAFTAVHWVVVVPISLVLAGLNKDSNGD